MQTPTHTADHYDPADFARNPGKYRLFKTARIAVPIPSRPDLQPGDFVAVRFFNTAYNALAKQHEPVYTVTKRGKDTTSSCMLYANVLSGLSL